MPSGNAMAATMLVRLGRLCGRGHYLDAAEKTLAAFMPIMQQAPTAAGQMLIALDLFMGPTHEVVLLGEGPDFDDVLRDLRRRYWPNKLVAAAAANATPAPDSPLAGLFAGKSASESAPTAFICENFACQAPLVGRDAILQAWQTYAPLPAAPAG